MTMISWEMALMTERWSYMCHLTHLLIPKPFSCFSMGSTNLLPPMIANISTTQDNNEVLLSSGDPNHQSHDFNT